MTTSPAPWHYDAEHVNVYDDEGRNVAARPIYSSCAATTEEADMRLISAAPDLLAALELVLETHSPTGGSAKAAADKARAAIAKAKGA